MSLRIRTTIGGQQYFLDLYDNEPVNMAFGFAEIQDITQKNSAFSQSFTIPGTKNNNFIFNYYYDISATPTTFDPNDKFPAIMTWDGYEILQGNIRLESLTIDQDEIIYEITFYNQVGDLAANIGDKFLYELNFSALTHPYNADVIPYSQQDPNLMPLTGATNYPYQNGKTFWGLYNIGYVYISGDSVNFQTTPLVQFTPFTGGTYSGRTGFFDNSTTPVKDFYFKPSIQVKTLYEMILNQNGYELESNFFETSYFQKFYMPLKFLDETIYPANAQLPCYTIVQSARTVSSGLRNYIDPLNNHICNNLGWSANTQGFIIPTDNAIGTYVFRISYTVSATNPCLPITPNNAAANLYFDDDLVNPGSLLFETYMFCSGQTSPKQIVIEHTKTITAATFMSYYFVGEDTEVTDFRLEIVNAPKFLVSGQTIDYKIEFPPNDYKQIDFITSVNKYFNLVVVPNPDKPSKLIVEPIVDYIGKGRVLDWSTKIDHLQPIGIQPTTTIINGTLMYNFQLDQDYANQNYKTASNRIFGTEKKNLGIKYKNENTEFNLIFSSPIDITILPANANMLTLSSFSKINQQDEGGKPILQFLPFKILPRMLFRGLVLPTQNYGFVGSSGATPYQYWYSRQVGITQQYDHFQEINHFTTYPFNYNDFSHYINWRGEDVSTIQPPEYQFVAEDLYDIYYKDYIDDLISPENKIYSAKIYLYPNEVKQLRYDEKIIIDNQYFRINKISNFNLLEPSICDIELVKLTKQYRGHRIKYYDLYSCSGGTTYHSNSDLNYNLYAYIGNFVKLYDDSLNYLGCYSVSGGTYNSGYTYQHFYLASGYTASGVSVYDDCSCTGFTNFDIVQETPVQSPTPTLTPGLSPTPTPSNTPPITPTPTQTNTPGLSPTPTPSITPAICDCYEAITYDSTNGFVFTYYDCNGVLVPYSIPAIDVGLVFQFCGNGPFTTITGSGIIAATGQQCVGGACP